MLDGIWSPVYGKVSVLDNHIVHFDLYLAAGYSPDDVEAVVSLY